MRDRTNYPFYTYNSFKVNESQVTLLYPYSTQVTIFVSRPSLSSPAYEVRYPLEVSKVAGRIVVHDPDGRRP